MSMLTSPRFWIVLLCIVVPLVLVLAATFVGAERE